MKPCPEYELADKPEQERLNKIVDACMKHIRVHGEMSDKAFNDLVHFICSICCSNKL
jgi:hypothetical protein